MSCKENTCPRQQILAADQPVHLHLVVPAEMESLYKGDNRLRAHVAKGLCIPEPKNSQIVSVGSVPTETKSLYTEISFHS